MIDTSKIFHIENTARTTDISELLCALVDPSHTIEERKELWREWQCHYYNCDDLMNFFDGALFNREDGVDYSEVMCKTQEYKNFYELAMSLDMANLDPRAYYLYWIMKYDKARRPVASNLVNEALNYDPDTIKGMFPDIEQVIMNEGV